MALACQARGWLGERGAVWKAARASRRMAEKERLATAARQREEEERKAREAEEVAALAALLSDGGSDAGGSSGSAGSVGSVGGGSNADGEDAGDVADEERGVAADVAGADVQEAAQLALFLESGSEAGSVPPTVHLSLGTAVPGPSDGSVKRRREPEVERSGGGVKVATVADSVPFVEGTDKVSARHLSVLVRETDLPGSTEFPSATSAPGTIAGAGGLPTRWPACSAGPPKRSAQRVGLGFRV